MMEEAKKRDHRILGKQLKIFTLSDLVGSWLPLFQPNGMVIRKELTDYLRELHKPYGYQWVWTPHLAKEALYECSGHAWHYLEDMFHVHGWTSKEDYFLKPMNCPHHMQLFADNQFSYRDMPIRYFEPATVYRDEKTWQLSWLTRVRSITQDDGHLFCRIGQLKSEITTIVTMVKEFYTTVGMIDKYRVSFSVRWEDKTKYLGSDENWAVAEKALKEICDELGLNYKVMPGEAAFYGPKLDFQFNDAIGRERQLATIQIDFNQPERFDLAFVNEEWERERPVVIHRAISGSLERFIGLWSNTLLELFRSGSLRLKSLFSPSVIPSTNMLLK
jgi:threonyl-tRNA synthetase